MRGLISEIEKEKIKIRKVLNIAEKQLTKYPDYCGKKVNVLIRHNTLQFYIKNKSRYQYVRVKQKEEAVNIVRQEYYKKICKSASRELKLLDKLEEHLKNQSIDCVYKKIGVGKQRVVKPILIPQKQFTEDWVNEKYQGKGFDDNNVEIYTDKGERVRSKSEKIIADKLYRENILYRYEYPLEVPGYGVIYPDFTILDEINQRNIIYEHFGMMDDERYVNNVIAKLQLYANEGYILGDNLFFTMETSVKPFDSRMLDGIIQQLKPSKEL